MIEKIYCYILNKIRESYWITLMIFKLKINRKKLALNWDMTTIVMKKAVDRYIADGNKEIFEMGVGHIGIIAQYIKKIYPSNIISGCDIYEEFVQNALYNAALNNLEINYFVTNAEEFSKKNKGGFDLITCMELLEHVPDPLSIIKVSKKMIKSGGHIIFSTINRNIKSYILAILAGEYLLNLLPKGTHRYEKFIMPSELISWCNQYKLRTNDLSAIKYNPIIKTCSLTGRPDVNYILDVISDD